MLEQLEKYDIYIQELKEQDYQYSFETSSDFFKIFENELVQQGNFKSTILLRKSSTMIQLVFEIEGVLELTCDRSLEPFEYPFKTKAQQLLKFGEHFEEQSEELTIIPWKTVKINLANYLYEFVLLAIPMKKLHPRFISEIDDDSETILVYSSDNQVATTSEASPDLEESLQKLQQKWSKKKQK